MERHGDDDDPGLGDAFDWEDETVETHRRRPAPPPGRVERPPAQQRTLREDLERIRERVPPPVLVGAGVLLVVIVVVVVVLATRGGDGEEAGNGLTLPASPPAAVEPTEESPSAEPAAPAPSNASPSVSVPEDVTLHLDDEGEAVQALQRALIQLGLLSDDADGIFGERTQAAVEAFQESAGLAVDGVVGPATAAAINQALGRAG